MNSDGVGLAGVSVVWQVVSGISSVSPELSSTTDPNGVASAQWTLGDIARHRLTATASGLTKQVTFWAFGYPATPTNVVARLGPGGDEITVSWDTVPRVNYRVYRDTAPGIMVVKETVLSGNDRPPFRVDNLMKGTTYYFVVVGYIGIYNSDPSTEVHARIPTEFAISVQKPKWGQLVGDTLEIEASITSVSQIARVVGEVEGRQVDVLFSNVFPSAWRARLVLAGLPWGEKLLAVTATDVFDSSATVEVPFVYDQAPNVEVTAPLAGTVANPTLRVQATCQDDDPRGCLSACRSDNRTSSWRRAWACWTPPSPFRTIVASCSSRAGIMPGRFRSDVFQSMER